MSSQLIQQDCHLTQVEENVMFALVTYKAREMLAHAAVPVWSVFAVEKLLDELTDVLFLLELVDSLVHLRLHISLHVLIHFADDPVHVSFRHSYNKFKLYYE